MSTRTDLVKVPKPVVAGPEMKALGRFYRDVTWRNEMSTGGGWFLVEEYSMVPA